MWDCIDNAANDKWTLDDSGHIISELNNSKCLDISGANQNNGANVIMWECHDGANQKWSVTESGYITSNLNNKCISISGVNPNNGANVVMWECVDGVNQKWSTTNSGENKNSNLVSNGGFEAPLVTSNGGAWQIFPDGTSGLGWSVTGSGLELQRGVVVAADEGQQSAELDGYAPVTISQRISTDPETLYKLSFASMARPNTPAPSNGLLVTWNGVDVSFGLVLGNSWETTTVQVTGTGNTDGDVLVFIDTGYPDGLGTFVDDVSLTLWDE